MADIEGKCFSCGQALMLMKGFSRREECESCGADVHSCKNCRFYDPGAYNECKEPSAEVVREKERANHCDFFEINQGAQGGDTKSKDLLAAAEALFKKD